jgi:2-keto-4-pentenoate hydratase/2-oxohepta-3-ene-1,7-dioic acid hydratase in catechol pathway
MRLATFLPPGSTAPRAGTVDDGRVTAFADERVTVLDVLRDPTLAPTGAETQKESATTQGAATQAQDGSPAPTWALTEVTLLAPVPAPRAIFGIGLNYADHIAETGGERPERPLVFMKLPASAAPPNGAVRCPQVVRRLDYEGELAVVIGAGGTVAGYAVADDVSARDLQGREPQWTRAKGADGFCPYGPWITTADEVPDPHALGLRTWVNGELRQDSSTSNLIFTVPELVAFIAETCTLEPGDLILTGTPAGVGIGLDPPRFLASGDVVRIEIERLGAIEHPIA